LKSSRKPLTDKEITERALERGLIVTHGKTPVATMAAELYKHLGTDPQLVKTGDRGPARAKGPAHAKYGTVRWTLRDRRNRAR
jgi:hypothetical protein